MDRDTVRMLAHLARLALDEAEEARAAGQITRLLDAFRQLQEVDVTGVAPRAAPLPRVLAGQPDVPEPPLAVADVLRNAPAARAGAFVVPRVVET
jgi:aspartyl-tRNA(Asn)/glutamyl-tRNA(Gln) amidotransferase subunit C